MEQAEVCDQAVRDFVREHLAWWVPAFAAGLRRKADHGLYHSFSRVLAALIPAERELLGIDPPFRAVQPELIEQPEEQAGCTGCPLLT
jgi:TorA maturation chaperone TorD